MEYKIDPNWESILESIDTQACDKDDVLEYIQEEITDNGNTIANHTFRGELEELNPKKRYSRDIGVFNHWMCFAPQMVKAVNV